MQQLAQSAFQQALASELPAAFSPVVLNDDMHNRVFNRFWQAANAPSSHKAKRGLQKYFREIENFCNLNPEARLAAVSGLSILNE